MTSIMRTPRTVWNNPEIGIKWSHVVEEYKNSASAEGYSLDEESLNLNDKAQKRFDIKDTLIFTVGGNRYEI